MQRLEPDEIGCARIVGVAADAAGSSEEVHRGEDAIHADKREPKVPFAERFVHGAAEHFREPIVDGREDPKDCSDAHDEMKMRDDEVGGVEHVVDGGLREENSREAAGDEK